MGQIAFIIKSPHGDNTNGGVTGGDVTHAFIVNVFGHQTEADAPGLPRLALIDHPAGPQYSAILVPVDENNDVIRKGMGRGMFGGNQIELEDGLLRNVHDRFETQREYDRLSR